MENLQPPLQVVKFWFKIYIFVTYFLNKKRSFFLLFFNHSTVAERHQETKMMLEQQKKSIPEIEVHERPGFGKAGHSFEVHSNFYGVKIRKKQPIYSLKIKS